MLQDKRWLFLKEIAFIKTACHKASKRTSLGKPNNVIVIFGVGKHTRTNVVGNCLRIVAQDVVHLFCFFPKAQCEFRRRLPF